MGAARWPLWGHRRSRASTAWARADYRRRTHVGGGRAGTRDTRDTQVPEHAANVFAPRCATVRPSRTTGATARRTWMGRGAWLRARPRRRRDGTRRAKPREPHPRGHEPESKGARGTKRGRRTGARRAPVGSPGQLRRGRPDAAPRAKARTNRDRRGGDPRERAGPGHRSAQPGLSRTRRAGRTGPPKCPARTVAKTGTRTGRPKGRPGPSRGPQRGGSPPQTLKRARTPLKL